MKAILKEAIIEGTNITVTNGINRLADIISSRTSDDAAPVAAFRLLLEIRGDVTPAALAPEPTKPKPIPKPAEVKVNI